MKKSKFNLTHLHSATLDAGYLVPFLLQPTLPNDTFRIGLSTFLRAQPMLAPLMHEVYINTQYWFVPYRLLWDSWEEFITGGPNLSAAPNFPVVTSTAEDAKVGSLWDYFGFPLKTGVEVSAMPFRALAEIWNTRYRDEDLQTEIPISYGSGADTITSRALLSPCIAKDYFSISRPFTQRGADIFVPINAGEASQNTPPVIHKHTYRFNGNSSFLLSADMPSEKVITLSSTRNAQTTVKTYTSGKYPDGFDNIIKALNGSGFRPDGAFYCHARADDNSWGIVHVPSSDSGISIKVKSFSNYNTPSFPVNGSDEYLMGDLEISGRGLPDTAGAVYSLTGNLYYKISYQLVSDSTVIKPGASSVFPSTLQIPVRLPTDDFTVYEALSSGGLLSVRALRESSALQRYAERSLKYGNRYEEFIQTNFGISPRDSRIQRPEYLGGGRGLLNISEVLQTAESTDTGVGTMRGHGIGAITQRRIKFRSPEHGIIIGLLSIRPKTVYTQGIDREFLKRSRLDFFTPDFANIGMQEVLTQEIYADAQNKGSVFGYSDRYQEYRYHKPLVTGEFRGNLNFWNMALEFANQPELNAEFVNMATYAENWKRPFQIQDNSAHAFICMLKNHIRAYRPIPKRAKDILR